MIQSRTRLYYERARDLFQRARTVFLSPSAAEKYRAEIRRRAFTTIEQERRWGESQASGWGSTREGTQVTRSIIVTVIKQFKLQSMLDVACGDFVWMPLALEQLPIDFKYVGCDIVPALIERNTAAYPQYEFSVLDFVTDKLPCCDLIFCRDALQHLPVVDIKTALESFSNSGASYLLASTHLRRSGWKNARECRVGQCRDRNLLLKPFDLPDPIAVFSEEDPSHKFLGFWKLPFDKGWPDGRGARGETSLS